MQEQRESARIKDRNLVVDEVTRNRRQKKALEALEKDNFQDDIPASGLYVSDYKLQLNKKLQQRFSVVENPDPNEPSQTSSNTSLHSSLSASQFINNPGESETKKRKFKTESKLRYRKNFAALLEEEQALASEKKYNYFSINVGPSSFPSRKFCAVCGFTSPYTCVQCGTKYCSSKCLQTHKDTRCLKWIA